MKGPHSAGISLAWKAWMSLNEESENERYWCFHKCSLAVGANLLLPRWLLSSACFFFQPHINWYKSSCQKDFLMLFPLSPNVSRPKWPELAQLFSSKKFAEAFVFLFRHFSKQFPSSDLLQFRMREGRTSYAFYEFQIVNENIDLKLTVEFSVTYSLCYRWKHWNRKYLLWVTRFYCSL